MTDVDRRVNISSTATNIANIDKRVNKLNIATDIINIDRRADDPNIGIDNRYRQKSGWLRYKDRYSRHRQKNGRPRYRHRQKDTQWQQAIARNDKINNNTKCYKFIGLSINNISSHFKQLTNNRTNK